MNGLHISISYMTTPELQRIGKELLSNPSDAHPGFYLRATKDEGYSDIVKYTRLPLDTVRVLAEGFDKALAPYVGNALRVALAEHRKDAVRRREAAKQQLAAAQATLDAIDAEDG